MCSETKTMLQATCWIFCIFHEIKGDKVLYDFKNISFVYEPMNMNNSLCLCEPAIICHCHVTYRNSEDNVWRGCGN